MPCKLVLDRILDGQHIGGAGVDASPARHRGVVVLPEPVGPVTSTMPCGCCTRRSKFVQHVAAHAQAFKRELRFALVQQAQHGALAMRALGRVETRTSMARPPMRKRDAAVLRQALLGNVQLCHDLQAARSARHAGRLFGCTTSRSVPSTRKRTELERVRRARCGCRWRRPWRPASASALSMRMMGASLAASSRSSTAGSSCIMRPRSTALSTSPTTAAALDSEPA